MMNSILNAFLDFLEVLLDMLKSAFLLLGYLAFFVVSGLLVVLIVRLLVSLLTGGDSMIVLL